MVEDPKEEQSQQKFPWQDIVDRSDKIMDIALKGGIAYAGYNALKNPMGAVYGLLGYKLATNEAASATIPNASRVAGLAILTHIGLTNVAQAFPNPYIGPGGEDLCPPPFKLDAYGRCR